MEDLFGRAMSRGTMTNLAQATAQALAAPFAEVAAYVQTPPVAHLDETGWREGHARLAVGGRHRLGHGLCGAPVAGGTGGAGAVGGTVLWHPGDGPLARLYLVSHPMAAGLWSRCCGTLKP